MSAVTPRPITRAPVSLRSVIGRLNRKLEKKGQALHKSGDGTWLGAYFIVGCDNTIINSGIDEDLTIRARQHGDVSARPFEDADFASQLVQLDRGLGSVVADHVHDVACFRVGL